jgi:hypothetical protein
MEGDEIKREEGRNMNEKKRRRRKRRREEENIGEK